MPVVGQSCDAKQQQCPDDYFCQFNLTEQCITNGTDSFTCEPELVIPANASKPVEEFLDCFVAVPCWSSGLQDMTSVGPGSCVQMHCFEQYQKLFDFFPKTPCGDGKLWNTFFFFFFLLLLITKKNSKKRWTQNNSSKEFQKVPSLDFRSACSVLKRQEEDDPIVEKPCAQDPCFIFLMSIGSPSSL